MLLQWYIAWAIISDTTTASDIGEWSIFEGGRLEALQQYHLPKHAHTNTHNTTFQSTLQSTHSITFKEPSQASTFLYHQNGLSTVFYFYFSNTAGNQINMRTLEYWEAGRRREDIQLKEMEEIIRLSAFNEAGEILFAPQIPGDGKPSRPVAHK